MPFNLSHKKILLADDSTIMRMVLVMHLKRFTGAKITEAVNGLEALTKLAREKFDLLMTDINMPEMTGLELIRSVRTGSRATFPSSSSRPRARSATAISACPSERTAISPSP